MKRLLLLSVPLAFLAGCGPAPKAGCKSTGCSAGAVCNTNTGACEILPAQGGGGGSLGGGGGSTGGGGGSTGGGGGTDGGVDAGFDAGVVVDPFDDGGVFVPGDICSDAIPVNFDGGTVATVSVDLAAAQNQYKADCNHSSGDGNDLLFAVTLTEPRGLIITATDTSGKSQDAVLALISSPCPLLREVSCVDNTVSRPEVMTLDRVPAGTYYVLLENYADTNLNDGTYDVQFETVDPVPGPANDTCATAQALVFTNGAAMATGTTVGAFNDTAGSPLTCSATSASAPDVFYTLTLTQPQDVTVTVDRPTGSSLSPAIALTNVCGVGGVMNQRGCDTGAPGTFTARGVPAGTYSLVVDGNSSATGAFTLAVTLAPPTPLPLNDTCAMPATLVPSVRQMVDANAAALDYTYSCSGPSGGDVVYQFTTTMPQKATVTVTGTGGSDSVVSLRAAPCDTGTNEVACVDNTISAPEVLTALNLPAGTYYLLVAAISASAGQFGVELALDAPVLPPANDTCATPELVTLTGGTATRLADLTGAAADLVADCRTTANGGDVVYQVTVPTMQTLTVVGTPVGSVLDPVLFATSPVCAMATSEACVDVGSAGGVETLVVPQNTTGAPKTVFVVVKAYRLAAPGQINLTFTTN